MGKTNTTPIPILFRNYVKIIPHEMKTIRKHHPTGLLRSGFDRLEKWRILNGHTCAHALEGVYMICELVYNLRDGLSRGLMKQRSVLTQSRRFLT